MINLKPNLIKKRRKKEGRHYLEEKGPEAFRPTKENKLYLDSLYNKSLFINKALSFYILLVTNPLHILKELKNQRPKLYKYVGRKKFRW